MPSGIADWNFLDIILEKELICELEIFRNLTVYPNFIWDSFLYAMFMYIF